MTQELNIAMLGASGVGKTSLLTAMYKEFAHTLGKTNLLFKPELETFDKLNHRLEELKSLSEDFDASTGIESYETAYNFVFDLGKKGNKPEFRLKFQDYPGDWLDSRATAKEKEFITQLLSNSHVILIAIDSPALMEQNWKVKKYQGKLNWHEYTNRTDKITNLFQNLKKKVFGVVYLI